MTPLTYSWVLAAMMRLQPNAPWVATYSETAEAIAKASSEDPLFAGDAGPKKTAAVLVALAYFESNFNPNAIGDQGKSFGLFQIQPPTAKIDASLLQLPRNAAYVAIDLIRTSFSVCKDQPFAEKLAWYAAGSSKCLDAGKKPSEHRLLLAQRIEKW